MDIRYVRVLNDRMKIVEMERVFEVVRIDSRNQHRDTAENGEAFSLFMTSTLRPGGAPREYEIPLDRKVTDEQHRFHRNLGWNHGHREITGQESNQRVRERDVGRGQQQIARQSNSMLFSG